MYTSNLCGAILVSVEACVLLCLLDSFLSRSTDRNMTLQETDSTSTLPGEVAKGIVRRVENHMILSMTSVSICAKVSVRLSMELMQTWCMLCQREVDSFLESDTSLTLCHVICRHNPFCDFQTWDGLSIAISNGHSSLAAKACRLLLNVCQDRGRAHIPHVIRTAIFVQQKVPVLSRWKHLLITDQTTRVCKKIVFQACCCDSKTFRAIKDFQGL